jgi:hypothetical protein
MAPNFGGNRVRSETAVDLEWSPDFRRGGFTSISNNFVGRERELAELVSACASGADSETHLFSNRLDPEEARFRLVDTVTNFLKITRDQTQAA